MQHAVVFRNDMKVASAPSHAHQLGDHPVRVWDGMNDVAAHGEVVAQVGCGKRVHALVIEDKPRRQTRVARSRQLQMLVDDVDSEHARLREKLGEARGSFTGAAAGIEYPWLRRQCIATDERRFLRPDSARLRGEITHHRLIGHLFGLRVEIGHDVV